ncbi:MAG: tetratricopeptide repeat protein [Myxococcota bacterium]
MRWICLTGWIAVGIGGLSSAVAAQTPEGGTEAATRAQRLFMDAATARENGRWDEARDLLTESLQLFPHFPTAWNLAHTLQETDALAEAETLLERILAGEFRSLSVAERRSVTERLEAVAAQLGTLVATVPPGLGTHIEVEGLDAIEPDAAGRAVLRLAPGWTEVMARAETHLERQSVLVVAGESVSARFELAAPIEEPADEAPVDSGSSSIFASPWFWLVTGAVIAAGTVTALVLLLPSSDDPVGADFMTPPL